MSDLDVLNEPSLIAARVALLLTASGKAPMDFHLLDLRSGQIRIF